MSWDGSSGVDVWVRFLMTDDRRREPDWLSKAVRRHGGEWPETVMASIPPQMVFMLPDASSALAFCNELNADGEYAAELASERWARYDRRGLDHTPPDAGPPGT